MVAVEATLVSTNSRAGSTPEDHYSPLPPHVSPKVSSGIEKTNRICFCFPTKQMACGVILIIIGVIFLLIGLGFGFILPSKFNTLVKNEKGMCKDADITEQYRNPYGDCDTCVPMYYSYYPFNVTNAEAVLRDGSKPIVQEQGPYAYRKFSIKTNITFQNNEVSYRSYNKWTFDQAKSCAMCKESDIIVKPETAYLAVVTQAGGEKALLDRVYEQKFADKPIPFPKATIQKGFNAIFHGLSSMDGQTMFDSAMVLENLEKPNKQLAALSAMISAGNKPTFYQNGIFVGKTIKQDAYGMPSFLAGLPFGSIYKQCNLPNPDLKGETLLSYCQKTALEKRLNLFNQCDQCIKSLKVVKGTATTFCKQMGAVVESQLDNKSAELFMAATCEKCETKGAFCLAPLPGAVEASGKDYNLIEEKDIIMSTLPITVQKTGCDGDLKTRGDYITYEGQNENLVWIKQDKDNYAKNPTAKDLIESRSSAYCGHENAICAKVFGGDGSSTEPGGASIMGLNSKNIMATEKNLFVSQAKENVTVYDTGKFVDVKGIELRRYQPLQKLLSSETYPGREITGIGIPMEGVKNLGYAVGFMAYLSLPYYIHGDKRLLSQVELKSIDGVTPLDMYEDGKLKQKYADKYETYVDVELATGKTFNARKRLMASFAFAAVDKNSSISDFAYPKIPPNLMIPVYWGEESATIPSNLASKFKSIRTLGQSFLPVLIVGLLFGIILIAIGIVFIRRHRENVRATAYSSTVV